MPLVLKLWVKATFLEIRSQTNGKEVLVIVLLRVAFFFNEYYRNI